MLLAGIVMKLGAYAGLRVAMNLFPQGFQMWSKWIVLLAVVGIVYAAAVALRQRDLKFVIGYSSVSHMGFVLLGLGAATALSVSGAVLQMFSHGVIAALLFAVAGRMIYRRTHTRELDALAGLNLSRALPFAAFTFVVASAASMGIPGFSGFAAEITILIGAWKTYPLAVWITGAGMVLVAAFTLRALKQSFFGETRSRRPACSKAEWRSIRIGMSNKPSQPRKNAALACSCSRRSQSELYPKLLLDRIHAGRGGDEVSQMKAADSTISYLELLKLASPETIVVITALAVLSIGLVTGRVKSTATVSTAKPAQNASDTSSATGICSAVAALGLAVADRHSADVAAATRPFWRDACDHAAHVAVQNYLYRPGFLHSPPDDVRKVAASSGRISGACSASQQSA